ncbi:hypothetical protein Tco_1003062 [Tanacetum coccineum]|uniref:Uncharacterized protein n=1 Tax=Tanacetum coccineum TaxID=301880 RepID=A0ABQ5F8Z6_9ASTR
MFVFFDNTPLQNTMAEQNVPNHPPTRTDEHIVPRSQCGTILEYTTFPRIHCLSNVPVYLLATVLENNVIITRRRGFIVVKLMNNGSSKLGYPEPVEIISNIRVNYVYQPWRAILSLINQLILSGKDFLACDKPRPPSSANGLWDSSLNLMLIIQSVMGRVYSRDPDIFLTQGKSQNQSEGPKEENHSTIPLYYPMYLENGCLDTKKNPLTPAPTKKPSKHKLPQKIRKGKPSFQLVDEDDEAQQESAPQEEGDDPDLEMAKKMSLETHQEKGEGEGDDALLTSMNVLIKLKLGSSLSAKGGARERDVVTEEQVAHSLIDLSKKKRTTDQFILVRRDQSPHDSTTGPSSQHDDDTSEKVIHESSSTSDSERTESETEAAAPKGDKDQDEVDRSTKSLIFLAVITWSLLHNQQEAYNITTSLPEITPFIALQLRVARLEQEMSEVKKTDHSADVLERHTADLIEKYSVLPGPESVKNQESEKSPKEIIRAKKEQGEEKQDSTYSIRSTDKVNLEEFDLKSASSNTMNKIKMKMPWIKEVADKVKDHKRKHDSDDDEDDDDDEGPSAGSNQGRSTKRRRSDSAASGSAHPPPKDDDQSSKKPRESDASASKQHPALTSTGWQITDTRDAGVDSSMHRSDPESEHSEQSSDDIPMQDEGNDSDMEDTDNAHIPKVSTTTWFKPIPESERPATPEPEWTIPPNDFPDHENNGQIHTPPTVLKRTGKKKLCKADLEGPAFNLVKAFHKNSVFLQYQMDECHKTTDK